MRCRDSHRVRFTAHPCCAQGLYTPHGSSYRPCHNLDTDGIYRTKSFRFKFGPLSSSLQERTSAVLHVVAFLLPQVGEAGAVEPRDLLSRYIWKALANATLSYFSGHQAKHSGCGDEAEKHGSPSQTCRTCGAPTIRHLLSRIPYVNLDIEHFITFNYNLPLFGGCRAAESEGTRQLRALLCTRSKMFQAFPSERGSV